jgi:hypothetical protein
VKRPRKSSTNRARRFCQALGDLSERRPLRWRMLVSVADRLGVSWDDAEAAANEAAAEGWLTIQGGHSVCLTEEGRQAIGTAAGATSSAEKRKPRAVHRYVSPADKLARQILKAATNGLLLQPVTLSNTKASFAEATADDIRAAIGHAIRSGWLIAREGGWRLTAAGEETGRRSRAGIR